MSKNTQPTPQNDEVDLGQLFKMIGNVFQKLFDFIASIFKGIFKLIILFLTHVFNNIKWYGLVLIIGLTAGYFLEKSSEKLYAANMFIETNFNSARQAYEVITEFNQLAGVDRDSVELAKRLNISMSEAKSLKGFYINADVDDNTAMERYISYKEGLDSVARLQSTFEDFKKGQNAYNYTNHKIGVAATDKFVFKKINDGLISEFLDNDYIKSILNTTLENLDRREAVIDEEIKDLEALKTVYLDIRKNESKKEYSSSQSQGTSIFMSGGEKTELIKDETQIVNKIAELKDEKARLALSRVENKQQINIISSFPISGYFIDKWYSNKMILAPMALLLLALLFFGIRNLTKYVKVYNN